MTSRMPAEISKCASRFSVPTEPAGSAHAVADPEFAQAASARENPRDSALWELMSKLTYRVDDLRDRPEFASVVANRVWRAWWQPEGYEIDFIEALVEQNLGSEPIPLALVAHDEERFFGTASVITTDLDARPQYTPWVAAVWVDPPHRSNGIGAALVRAGAETPKRLGFDCSYLTALPPKHAFYERLGWTVVEHDVTDAGLAVFRSP